MAPSRRERSIPKIRRKDAIKKDWEQWNGVEREVTTKDCAYVHSSSSASELQVSKKQIESRMADVARYCQKTCNFQLKV